MDVGQRSSPDDRPSWLDRCWPAGARRRARRRCAHDLYRELVNRARQPAFYRELGVPDTPEGRFEMVGLHTALVLRRLRASEGGRALGQELFDLMFADMDASLRELGVGDLSVGKYVKRLARNFHARLATLDAALGSDRARLRIMLRSNVFHGGPPPGTRQLDRLVAYLEAVERTLAGQGPGLMAGRIEMPRLASFTDGTVGAPPSPAGDGESNLESHRH